MTNYIYNECKGIVYHVTKNDEKTLDSIFKWGLKPRTASYRDFNERVLLIASDDKKKLKQSIDDVISILSDDTDFYNGCSVINVDLNKYHNRIRMFTDNSRETEAFFTKEYIPPFCLEIVKNI